MDKIWMIFFTLFFTCISLLVTGTVMGKDHTKPVLMDKLPNHVMIHRRVGQKIRFMCKVASNPPAFTTWYKDNKIIDGSERIQVTKHYLMIKKVQTEDAGEYHCKGENPFGAVTRKFTVSLKEESRNERKHENHEDGLKMIQQQLSELRKSVDRMSGGDLFLHMRGIDGEVREHEIKGAGKEKHVYLNMFSNDWDQEHKRNHDIHAHCEMRPNNNLRDVGVITGNVHIVQKIDGQVNIDLHLSGFVMTNEGSSHKHGFHIHHFGDMSNSCDSLGNIYEKNNGKNSNHKKNRTSIICDDKGEVHMKFTDDKISLHGQHSVIGRSIVIHDELDDRRLACCVIGRAANHDHGAMDRNKMHFDEELLLPSVNGRRRDPFKPHIDPYKPDYMPENYHKLK